MTGTAARILSLFLAGAMRMQASPPAAPFSALSPHSLEGIPQAFRITPSRSASFDVFEIIYNSKSGLYVVFYHEQSDRAYVYSRLYDSLGRTKSAPQRILALDKNTISGLAVAYNGQEDAFLLIGTDMAYDAINGMRLDGRGRPPSGTPKPIVVKPSSGMGSALGPSVRWLRSANQYVVTWTYDDFKNPANPRNGQYLTVLGRDFRPQVKPKLVKWQQMNQVHLASVVVLPDKLVWGSSVDSTGTNVKPAVWLTDFKGRIMTSVGVRGMLYPDGAVPAATHVWPVYDPDHERVLLQWSYIDGEPATFQENRYRVMDARGRFRTGVRTVPKREPFQLPGAVLYNPAEKRFFWVCAEYKITHQEKPERWFYGGKIWGFYLDSDGHFENKKGEDALSPIPLTYTFLDPTKGMLFDRLAISSADGSAFAAYEMFRQEIDTDECWGLIYR